MATKQKVTKALAELGATLTEHAGSFHYDEFEIVAPNAKVWAGNLCEVLCYEYDSDMMTKAEFWDEIMIDVEQGLIDESDS
jgi:hypothetical protein